MNYIDSDHFNTPRVITDANNRIVWQWDSSDPFGGNVTEEDPGNTGTRLAFNLRFPGQYFDKETGLHYNYFRDYDSATGRYVQSDPIGLEGGINTYAYVEGNPVSYVDPEGLQAEHTKNARNSTINKHQKAESRRQRDAGGEKGDKKRAPSKQRPPGHKRSWPPKVRGIYLPSLLEDVINEVCQKNPYDPVCPPPKPEEC